MIVELDQASMKLINRLVDQVQARRAGTSQESMAFAIHGDEKRDLMVRAYGAELAVSRLLGQEWNHDYTGPKGFDVAPNIEVRNTRPGRALYIKRREVIQGPYEKPASARYVLTWTGDDLTKVGIVGWITLGDALEEATVHQVDDKIYGLLFPAHRLRPIERLQDALQSS
jgi:hypothetical protein